MKDESGHSGPDLHPSSFILHPSRLVTLTGPGGSGKTRLAVEAGMRLREAYREAVWFVPLAGLSDAGQIAGAIRDAVQPSRPPGLEPLQQVLASLSPQPVLLV